LNRALREDATRRRAHAFRLSGTLLILVFLVVAHASSGGIAAPGRRFFELISWLNLALIVIAGASYFATAITEEKEQGTLGLLQLAGVSPLGLLLGKSTSRLIAVLLVFLGQLPFALLAVTLGGVTARQIIAVDIALAAFLVMVANVGLLSSVLMRRSGSACAWVLLALALLLLGVHYGGDSLSTLIALGHVSADSRFVVVARDLLQALNDVSIVTRLEEVLQTGFDGDLIGEQAWIHTAAGLIAFLLSWTAFNRFTRYFDAAVPARGWLPRGRSIAWRRRSALSGETAAPVSRTAAPVSRTVGCVRATDSCATRRAGSRTGPKAVGKRPPVSTLVAGGHVCVLLKFAAYPALLVMLWRFELPLRSVTGYNFSELSRLVMLAVIGGEACFYASRIYHEELKWGTLPNLAILPQPMSVIAYGKLAGCLLSLSPAVVVLLVLMTLVPAQTVDPIWMASASWWMVVMQWVILLHLTVLFSLTVKWGALALAVATLLILDALLALPFTLLIAGLSASSHDEHAAVGPIIYFGCGISAVLQVLIARRLRYVAAR